MAVSKKSSKKKRKSSSRSRNHTTDCGVFYEDDTTVQKNNADNTTNRRVLGEENTTNRVVQNSNSDSDVDVVETEKHKTILPTEYLFDYQKAFINDSSRFKLFLASRQIGKSFTLSCEVVRDCVLNPNRAWVCISRGDRQSRELLKKTQTMSLLWCSWAQERGLQVNYETKSTEVRFSNGSRIIALPANSDTIRGYTANVVLDEFAYHEKPEELWNAIFPTISNPINGNLRLIIASTPNGKNNKFWELWSTKNNFSKYKVSIHDAVESGLKINIKELKAGLGDDDAWRQEYECIPVESGQTLVSIDLIKSAQSHSKKCSREISFNEMNDRLRSIFVGVDIGRKHDLTCIWGLELTGGILRTCFIRELKHCDFEQQRNEIKSILSCVAIKKLCIDSTGIGSQLSEELYKMFGSKVEQCPFSVSMKQELFVGMQIMFQKGSIWIPADTKESNLSKDICSIQKTYSRAGNLSFFAPSNSDGHSDRATALALAIRASGEVNANLRSANIGSSPNGIGCGSVYFSKNMILPSKQTSLRLGSSARIGGFSKYRNFGV